IFLSLVNDKINPKLVASTTIQKNELVREYLAESGKFSVKNGTIISDRKCDKPVNPRQTASNNISSLVPVVLLPLASSISSIFASSSRIAVLSALSQRLIFLRCWAANSKNPVQIFPIRISTAII